MSVGDEQPEFDGDPTTLSDSDFAAHMGLPAADDTAVETAEDVVEELATEDNKGAVVPEPEAEAEVGVEAEAEGEGEVEGVAEAEGEGEVADAEAKAPAKATTYSVFDGAGDEVEIPDGLNFKFKANGKEHSLPLDRVVRLAQYGFYNEALQEEVKATRESLPEIETAKAKYEGLARKYFEFSRKLLEDDDYLLDQRTEYAKTSTPEARAVRAEAELASVRNKEAQSRLAAEAEGFVTSTLFPKFEALMAEHPDVSPEEFWGRWSLLTKRYEVAGAVPPKDWPRLTSLVDEDLAPWVAQVSLARNEKVQQARDESVETKRVAQLAVTKMKRKVAKAVMPSPGGRASGRMVASKPKEILTADDAIEDILRGLVVPQ